MYTGEFILKVGAEGRVNTHPEHRGEKSAVMLRVALRLQHENSKFTRNYRLKSYRNGNILTPSASLFVFTSLPKEATLKDIINSETLACPTTGKVCGTLSSHNLTLFVKYVISTNLRPKNPS
ncbi:MAG: hypothetical protein ACI9VT_001807 [Psychroserpens sp.]|jgi:hypothetical protein